MLRLLRIYFYKSLMVMLKLVARLLPQARPMIYTGQDSSLQMCRSMAYLEIRKVLIVTDPVLKKLGVLDKIIKVMDETGIEWCVYSDVLPDPTYTIVQEGVSVLREQNCDAVLAVGGGSPIDAAKVIAVLATNDTPLRKLAGVLKVKKPGLPLFAVPTTAGTGSEVTIAAVVSDPDTHQKTPVMDPKVVPVAAALDPLLMVGMPPHITAATGMDALTHAIEAYISTHASTETDGYAKSAIKMILKYLPKAYGNGEDLQAREAMALASCYAGLAFTKANLGYVHAISHNLGAMYQIPHGLANGIVLPYVLEYSRDAVTDRLAQLAVAVDLGTTDLGEDKLSEMFIDKVKQLCKELNIPEKVEPLNKADIGSIAKDALKEAHYLYPVPKYMDQRQCTAILTRMLP